MSTPRKKGSSHRSSAAIIGGNDDLLAELLILIPAHFLVKFQLVSKQWQSIICSPPFRRLNTLHHSRHPDPQSHSLILRGKITSETLICNPTAKTLIPMTYESRLSSEYPFIKLLQSCNGLLLLQCKTLPFGSNCYFVYNPTTLQSRNLDLFGSFNWLCLAFDPRKSPHYRVVCFEKKSRSPGLFISVYDSETHKWKDIGIESKLDIVDIPHGIRMYWNDAIYFSRFGRGWFFPLVMHPGDGSVSELRTPPVPNYSDSRSIKHHMIESNGRMHNVMLSMKPNSNWLHVWELSEVDFTWSNVCTVSLNPISTSFGWKYHIRLLGLIRGTREEDSMVVFHVPSKIMAYKIATETFETLVEVTMEIGIKRRDQVQFQFQDAYQLVHTLCPI